MTASPGRTVCVYCASSKSCASRFHDDARDLGRILAGEGWTIVYGGGRVGSMGALADGALAAGGRVVGIIPRFMQDLEWGHGGLSELQVVDDMRMRKHRMLCDADAVVALPGGTGTFEELLEALTLKRLGLFSGPIVLVNTGGFYHHLVRLLEAAIDERFMDPRHRLMWQLVPTPAEVVAALASSPPWGVEARSFAAM
ncbi:MAG: TIGR00730 family Rossman fold protein [Dehalococcoidia bacterium]